MTTNQPAPITQEQIAIAVQGFAQGDKISAIAEQTGLSPYRVRGLLKKKEVADAIDRMRLTDTIPTQLSAIMGMMSALSTWLENAAPKDRGATRVILDRRDQKAKQARKVQSV